MKRSLFAALMLLACVLGRPAHVAAQTTPIDFNDHIASITDSLYAMGKQWGDKFGEAYKTKNFGSLSPSRKALEKFIDARIAEVKNMKDVKNSKNLRMAMISFLTFEKSMAMTSFRDIELLKSTATDDEVQAKLAVLTTQSKTEAEELAKVSAAQQVYAKENGFSIETAKTEGKN